MIQKLKTALLSLFAASFIVAPVLMPATARAAEDTISKGLCAGASLTPSQSANCQNDPTVANKKIDDIISTVINLFSLVVGVVAVIMIIIGGLKYITSGGDSGNITGAKNTILYAVIGLVVVALAQIIVRFVLGKATN